MVNTTDFGHVQSVSFASNPAAFFGHLGTSNAHWRTVVQFGHAGEKDCGGIQIKTANEPRFVAPSDRRLKSNIVNAESMLNKFEALQVRRYSMTTEDGNTVDNVLGVIADEIQQVFPEAVVGSANQEVNYGNIVNSDGEVTQEDVEDPSTSGYTLEAGESFVTVRTGVPKYQGVAKSDLILPMVKVIQELIAENKALSDRITALGG